MAASPAQRKASAKWDRENRKTVSCTLRGAEIEDFQAAASANGTTPNALIRGWIRDYVARNSKNGVVNHDEM